MDVAPGPRELTLYVTSACDAACAFCRRESPAGIYQAGTMRPEFVRAVLARFPTVMGVCIAGFGEPLLVPWLGEIVRACREAGAFVGVITNGSRLAERLDEVAAWDLGGFGYVSVSLNATTAADHQRVFGFPRPCWSEVLGALAALVERGVNAGASFVVTRRTLGELPAMIALARALKLRFAHVHNFLPHNGPDDPAFLADVLREGDLEVEVAMRAASAAAAGAPISLPTLLPAAGEPSPSRCESPFMSIGVDARGHITGCRRVYEPSPMFGNIADPDVWHAPHFARYREELGGGQPNATCRACFGSVKG